MKKKIIFCDIDGTLVHYEKYFHAYGELVEADPGLEKAVYRDLKTGEERICKVMSSLNSGNAYISEHSIDLVKKIREKGILFALISGMRKSTLLSRVGILPEVDFLIGENGGRIYQHEDSGDLSLDPDWSQKMSIHSGQLDSPLSPDQRDGDLWNFYRHLSAQGWQIDSNNYWTNFRIDLSQNPNKTPQDLENIKKMLPASLACSVNLRKSDFYPATSGKGNAATHIMKAHGIDKKDTIAIIDDDNDIPLTTITRRVLIPEISGSTLRSLIPQNPHWYTSKRRGILGIEECLERILGYK